MRVETLLNVERGSRFWKYEPGAALVQGPTVEIPDSTPPDEVLDFVWRVGNRMDQFVLWPGNVRSLSVGDVIVLPGEGGWAVESLGFKRVNSVHLYKSRVAGRKS